MIERLQPVYRCEYCNKHMISKGAMSYHEKWCNYKPENQHKCFHYCAHLKKEVFHADDGHPDYPPTRQISFTCTKLNKPLYSYKAEKKNTRLEQGEERMPLQCDSYELMEEHLGYEPKNQKQ